MPYRLAKNNKRIILVQKGGKWKVFKRHKTEKEARAHLAALNINVKEA